MIYNSYNSNRKYYYTLTSYLEALAFKEKKEEAGRWRRGPERPSLRASSLSFPGGGPGGGEVAAARHAAPAAGAARAAGRGRAAAGRAGLRGGAAEVPHAVGRPWRSSGRVETWHVDVSASFGRLKCLRS